MSDDITEALHAGPRTPGVERLLRRAAERAAADGDAAVAYAVVDTPVGKVVAAATPRGLVRLAYEDFDGGVDAVLEHLAHRLSPAIVEAPGRFDALRRELDEYFDRRRETFDLPIDWSLTAGFTTKVLQATAQIPFGATASYKEVATRAGSERAVRAAGNALGANPIPIVVPCHRVLRTGGRLGGYTGGLERKEALLRVEGILV
jgi:methylated-DNA-[protein]-cysteine S-methyltransferase